MPYKIYLKKNEEKRILGGHSWVYANEVAKIEGKDENGSLAAVYANDGRFIGKGYINHLSKILVRIFIRSDEEDGKELYLRRIAEADAARRKLIADTCYRMVFAEADDLPALICDRYGDYLVLGKESAGLSEELLAAYAERCERIPMLPDSSSLANAKSWKHPADEDLDHKALRQQDICGNFVDPNDWRISALNLSNAAAIVLFEALRQTGFAGVEGEPGAASPSGA